MPCDDEYHYDLSSGPRAAWLEGTWPTPGLSERPVVEGEEGALCARCSAQLYRPVGRCEDCGVPVDGEYWCEPCSKKWDAELLAREIALRVEAARAGALVGEREGEVEPLVVADDVDLKCDEQQPPADCCVLQASQPSDAPYSIQRER